MSWVKDAISALERGEPAQVRPHGGSMRGRIESGQLVTIVPANVRNLSVGDIVFVRWKGNYLLHLVIELEPSRLLIGNNLGKVNGWAPTEAILGKVTDVA